MLRNYCPAFPTISSRKLGAGKRCRRCSLRDGWTCRNTVINMGIHRQTTFAHCIRDFSETNKYGLAGAANSL